MNQSRLEIKITKDVNERDVNLRAMSLQAAQSFLILFESVTKIVELTPDNKEIKIQITSGSAVVAAEGNTIAKAHKEFEKVLNNQSSNKELVEQWRRIQSVFIANGLHYEANFYNDGLRTSFYDELRNRQKLRARPKVQKKFETELAFLTGKLIAVGGKNPNIHVEVDGKALPPIACTESNATKAKAYLYQTIRFSAWIKQSGNKRGYTLCDSYATPEIYDELRLIIEDLFSQDQISALKKLHYQCRNYLDHQDYGRLRKFLRLFAHESTDINLLKTALVVTQSLREHERLQYTIETLKNIFNKSLRGLKKERT